MRFVYLGGVVKYVTGAGDVFVTNLTPPPRKNHLVFLPPANTGKTHHTWTNKNIIEKHTPQHTWTHKKIIEKHTPHMNTQENHCKTHTTREHTRKWLKNTPHVNAQENHWKTHTTQEHTWKIFEYIDRLLWTISEWPYVFERWWWWWWLLLWWNMY